MPVTLHQPLPSHWYISEARRQISQPFKTCLLEFGRESRPLGADRALPSIGRSTDAARSVRDRVLICSDGSLLQLPMDGGGRWPLPLWMSTRPMHLLKVPGSRTVGVITSQQSPS